jgi:transposase
MEHFAGLDVSVKDTSVCIVDDTGKIIREVKVASEPNALLAVLTNPAYHFKRIGLEAGPLSQWLFRLSPKQACRQSVSRHGTCGQC